MIGILRDGGVRGVVVDVDDVVVVVVVVVLVEEVVVVDGKVVDGMPVVVEVVVVVVVEGVVASLVFVIAVVKDFGGVCSAADGDSPGGGCGGK